MAKTHSEQGRFNRNIGQRFMQDLVPWLRGSGFIGADVISSTGRADIAGLLDWAVEAKNTRDWDLIGAYLDKVREIQQARRARWHVVLKKRRQAVGQPGNCFAVMMGDQWLAIARILDDPKIQERITELEGT